MGMNTSFEHTNDFSVVCNDPNSNLSITCLKRFEFRKPSNPERPPAASLRRVHMLHLAIV